jgi:hypothetical protein
MCFNRYCSCNRLSYYYLYNYLQNVIIKRNNKILGGQESTKMLLRIVYTK